MPKNSTNVRNRVNKLHLPKTKPLYPLFEVISNSDEPDMESSSEEEFNINANKTISPDDVYSQYDHTFMFELYRENRSLLDQIGEKDKKIAKLEERGVYLANSNMFWLSCYIGSTIISFFSIIHY